jgi:hypothetical protein
MTDTFTQLPAAFYTAMAASQDATAEAHVAWAKAVRHEAEALRQRGDMAGADDRMRMAIAYDGYATSARENADAYRGMAAPDVIRMDGVEMMPLCT